MRCPRCQFENIPGQERCLQCQSLLVAGNTIVDIHPPRMAGWKKPFRRLGARLRRIHILPGRPALLDRFLKERRLRDMDHIWGLVLSIIPGLAHLIQGRLKEIRYYLIGWLIAVILAVYFYGTSIGMCAVGLAIGLHAWIVVQHRLIELYPSFFHRLLLVFLVAILLALIYRLPRRLILPNLTGQNSTLTIPSRGVREGDYLLAWRDEVSPEHLQRGSLVFVYLRTFFIGDGLRERGTPRRAMGQIIGLPGERVEMRTDRFTVDGQPLDPNSYPVPGWLQDRSLSGTIDPGHYFVSSQYSVRVNRRARITNRQVFDLCQVPIEDMDARVFMRWLPVGRRAIIRDVE